MKNILTLIATALLFFSCNMAKEANPNLTEEETHDLPKKEIVKKENTDSINNLLTAEIKKIVTQLDSVNKKIDQDIIFSKYLLKDSYNDANFHPLWSSKKNRDVVIAEIKRAEENGLISSDYHLETIEKYTKKYDSLSLKSHAKLDVLLTDGIILLAYHLIKGKVNPDDLMYSWNFMENKIPKYAITLLQNAIKEEQVNKVLHSLEPQDKEYQLLKEQLITAKSLKEKGGWNTLDLKETLHPGDQNIDLQSLKTRLIAENFLNEDEKVADSIYGENLQKAVKKFQLAHGVNDDAVIGKATLKMLNEPIEDKIKKIIVNLERRRWIKYPKDTAYIKVNIASFKMKFIDHGKVTYSSNVVVGQTKKQTPSFMDTLELIVLNPTWTLPYSISSTETLSKLKKNPNYLETHNMVLMNKKGNIISSTGIDWSKLSSRHFPYRVRQKAGARNALGRVKFLFPNKYAIYLHDTPSKRLFSKDRRAFSHGCVRLQNPLDFAEFLLQKEDASWDRQKIDKIVASNKTKTIRLQHQHPILIIYQTAEIDEKRNFIYLNDIYKRDDKLYKLLTKPM